MTATPPSGPHRLRAALVTTLAWILAVVATLGVSWLLLRLLMLSASAPDALEAMAFRAIAIAIVLGAAVAVATMIRHSPDRRSP